MVDSPDLWQIEVRGTETIIAVQTEDAGQRMVREFEEMDARRQPDDLTALFDARLVRFEGTEEQHRAAVAKAIDDNNWSLS